jgi:adenylate cyclase
MKHDRHIHSFRFILAMAILVPLLLAMLAVGGLSFHYARSSVRELTDTIVRQTVGRVKGQLGSLIQMAQEQNQLDVLLAMEQAPEPKDFQRLATRMYPSFAIHSELDAVFFGMESTGEYFALERGTNREARLVQRIIDSDGHRTLTAHRWNNGRWKLEDTLPWDDYDPRQRPFYVQARAANSNVWSGAYEFWSTLRNNTVVGITHSVPVHDDAGNLLGVWGVDVDTLALCDYLAKVDSEVPGFPFVIEESLDGSHRLVAYSKTNTLARSDPASGAPESPVGDIQDPVIHAFLENLPDSFASLAVQGNAPFAFHVNGRNYLGGFDIVGGRWMVAMAIPESEVMARVWQNGYWFIGTFTAVMAASLIGIILLARKASRPLMKLHQVADAVGRLELDPAFPDPTRILEIRELAEAMAKMKVNLRSFQKYVPADLVGDLVRSGQEAALGGHMQTVTIFFSDITNFTGAAEKLEPERLVDHLAEYLDAVSTGIALEHGTVDKFIGDAVMAFWNAPHPKPDHAAAACRAALKNQRMLDMLGPRWQAGGKPAFATRIGIHTGPVVVGNIGSEHRMNYTVIGDSVNLASRLEELNKTYGTRILISESTRDAAGGAILARPVDSVNVKGKTDFVKVYELICEGGTESARQKEQALLTERAFEFYLRNDRARAATLYRELVQGWPDDPVAAVMLARCSIA